MAKYSLTLRRITKLTFLLLICCLFYILAYQWATREKKQVNLLGHSHDIDISHRDNGRVEHTEMDGDVQILPWSLKLKNYVPNAFAYPVTYSSIRNPILSFFHSPKSGGLTVRDCMLRLYRKLKKDEPVMAAFFTVSETQEKLLNNVSKVSDYYMGDSAMGICDHVGDRPCSYFTMWREPYERIISQYFWCRVGRGGQTPSCNTTLEKYTLVSCSLLFRQLTARVLCHQKRSVNGQFNVSWKCDPKPTTIDHLKKSRKEREVVLTYFLENLDKMFTVIGLKEEFNTSLKLFETTYREPFYEACHSMHSNEGFYVDGRENKAKNKKLVQESKQRLMANEEIRQCLYEDVKLYEKAKEIFAMQTKNSPSFK
ncbi:hypothetical protein HOLleu_27116 [Holothuria leucospilota]|uniref:Uncharacterized protein n=1 Tax=Holothuria leucospilota TaxID=206669 RepID=A0A9Q1H3A5_HOLLE|nr:hypothetical protein HOLleu_27116 [Holothuria leucospilota]